MEETLSAKITAALLINYHFEDKEMLSAALAKSGHLDFPSDKKFFNFCP